MKVHYFQRYHQKENVATANTMLLLSRFYQYSPDKFFRYLKSLLNDDDFDPEISFSMQDKGPKSIPDACLAQPSFKICIETKMCGKSFDEEQLFRHLDSFKTEDCRVLVTLAPSNMPDCVLASFEDSLKAYNESSCYPIAHVNLTFSDLVSMLEDFLDDRDYEMSEIVADYFDYCLRDGLIVRSDSWRYLRMQLANGTFDFNIAHNVYFDKASRGFRPHDYLGLYRNKSLRAIGKITAQVVCVEKDGVLTHEVESGDLTDDRKAVISECIREMRERGHDIKSREHRYFFVERFYETDYEKTSPRAPMGTRIFDISEVLETSDIPPVEEIARMLRGKSWS